MTQSIRAAVIGAGGMARHHIPLMLEHNTEIVVLCEPNNDQLAQTAAVFEKHDLPIPPNEPDLARLLHDYGSRLDVAFIITPHHLHYDQAKACMEAGLDVLLEKPMVTTVDEALGLIETRDRTGRLLVVAFQGGLSPQVRHAADLLRSGELGSLLGISGVVWQNWRELEARGTWRTNPATSGGGFMFDTGAHMLNTVCDLLGEDVTEVAAWFDNRGMQVDILAAVMARTASGTLVTLQGCGDALPSCASWIQVFTTDAMVETGQWGERLSIQRRGEDTPSVVELPPMRGAWEQFLDVRAGAIANPCPPEVGLRMIRLWEAIKRSAHQNGTPVRTTEVPA